MQSCPLYLQDKLQTLELLWVPKWGLVMHTYSWATLNTSYWSPLQAQYQNCTRGTLMTAVELCQCVSLFSQISSILPQTSIKFTDKISPVSVEFLDILVNIKHGQFTTSVFYKLTDAYSYLYFHPSHYPITKVSIPYPQYLCLWRLLWWRRLSPVM